MRVLSVVGNRPQFIKSAPLSVALREAGIDEVVLHTGQHWDPEMSQVFFDELSIPEPAYRLDLRTADVDAMTAPIRDVVAREQPDWVLVYGDTNTSEREYVFPVHPRTRHALDENGLALGGNVEAVEPLGYLEMLALVAAAETVVTDSGGLQKEAYWLRVPCVTLRPSTEWVDTVAVGANRLAGPGEVAAALEEASFPEDAPELYGDGHAAARIAEALYTLTRQ